MENFILEKKKKKDEISFFEVLLHMLYHKVSLAPKDVT